MYRKRKRSNTHNRRRATYRPRKRYRPPRPMTKRRRMMNMRTGGIIDTEIKFLDVNRSETALTAPPDCTGMEIQPSSGCTRFFNAPVQVDIPSQIDSLKLKCLSIFIQAFTSCPEATGVHVREIP